MTETAVKDGQSSRTTWLLFAYAILFFGGVSTHLLWLMWRYVPLHAAVFAGMGVELPRSTIVALIASNWTVRLFPLIVILGAPLMGGAAVAFVLASRKWTLLRVARGVAMLVLVIASAESVACALVVHGIHAGYAAAANSSWFQERLRSFEEYRRQQRVGQPQP